MRNLWLAALATSTLLLAACGGSEPEIAGVAGGAAPSTKQPKPSRQSLLAYSQCMRKHGIADFPDPKPNGELTLSPNLDPKSAKFQAAREACGSLAPAASLAKQRESYVQGLKFARCIRAHGFPDYPDPEPPSSGPHVEGGTGGTDRTGGYDPGSPAAQTALAACRQYLPGGGAEENGSGR
jgi:hypothetical protein